ncbi:MAG: tyrosine-protein phosphatase [Sphingobacteriales bacterium]|nr:tyrosine-protein phosphatase [Sphingobacteriales bacterium]
MLRNFLLSFMILPFIGMAQVKDSARREIKLQGAINFRDIGGYPTKDGGHVKWGKIYRSAALNNLTPDDLRELQHLSLAFVADFRGPYEVRVAPDRLPVNVTRLSLPAGSEAIGDTGYMRNMIQRMRISDSVMYDFYGDVAPFHARYEPVFEELLTLNKDSALLFHCTAGKDRTGIAAALILYALGVDEQTIMNDYAATNYYRDAENKRAIAGMMKIYGLSEAAATNMMAAREDYLRATFAAIRAKYGTVDYYLEKEMGLDKEKLRKLRSLYVE